MSTNASSPSQLSPPQSSTQHNYLLILSFVFAALIVPILYLLHLRMSGVRIAYLVIGGFALAGAMLAMLYEWILGIQRVANPALSNDDASMISNRLTNNDTQYLLIGLAVTSFLLTFVLLRFRNKFVGGGGGGDSEEGSTTTTTTKNASLIRSALVGLMGPLSGAVIWVACMSIACRLLFVQISFFNPS